MPKSPAFQFYPTDFLVDANTILMSAEEIGVYCLLLFHCWVGDGLPENCNKIAKLSRLNCNKFQRIWDDKISACFYFDEESRKYRHRRLDKELKKQQDRSDRTRASAQARWDANAMRTDANAYNRNALHLQSSSSSDISLDISSERLKRKSRQKKELTELPEDFKITDSMRDWFSTHCSHLNLEIETEKFKERCNAKGTVYKDWTAGWRTQMLNAEEWSNKALPSSAPDKSNWIMHDYTDDPLPEMTVTLADN